MQTLICLLVVAATTAFISLLENLIQMNQTSIVYLIPIIIAAARWGIWPASVMAVASTGAADFFFIPPLYSFRIDDPQEALDLLLFLFVALVTSNLTARLWRETEALRRREIELQDLYELSQRLAACFTASDLTLAIQRYLSRTLQHDAVFVPTATEGQFDNVEMGPIPPAVQERMTSIRDTAGGLGSNAISDETSGDHWLIRDIGSEASSAGIIAVNIGGGSSATITRRMIEVDSVLKDATATLKRIDIGKALNDAWFHRQTQLLKDALHGTLSHELRSPLAAIQGSASVLRTVPALRNDLQSNLLIEGILDEVEQLDGFIANLVNATRVTTTGIEARKRWADPQDIINAALQQRARRIAGHIVRTDFAKHLPLVNVDSVLVEEAFGQLLGNAAKYSPLGSTLTVAVRTDEQNVVLSVSDQGAGIEHEEQSLLGQRSFRSARHRGSTPGSGLGLWIATTFIRANGGSIAVSSQGIGLGTVASIRLPASWVEPADMALMTDE